jgi:hypothetical protein
VTSNTSYDVTLTTEGTRLGINQLGTNSTAREFAIRLFEKWGMDKQQAETLAESIAGLDRRQRPATLAWRRARLLYGVGPARSSYNRPLDNYRRP